MPPERSETSQLIGESPAFLTMLEHVSRAATLAKPVLVVGERGTGKELIASRLHYLSERWDRPLVKVNCAALTESLLETELFGHEAGAFTGATRTHAGRFEQADGGTLVLDEIGTISLRMQEKILRAIEYGEFQRVGGTKTLKTDARVVGATNANLPRLAAEGRFRADLMDRLAFDVIHVPPLRARGEDIPRLAYHFAVNVTSELQRDFFAGFAPEAAAALAGHPWPGNVRELKNAVERSVYRAERPDEPIRHIIFDPFESPFGPPIDVVATGHTAGVNALGVPPASGAAPWASGAGGAPGHDGPGNDGPGYRAPHHGVAGGRAADVGASGHGASGHGAQAAAGPWPRDFREAVAQFERDTLEAALEQAKYRQTVAARLLGLTYHQLRGLLKKHGLKGTPRVDAL